MIRFSIGVAIFSAAAAGAQSVQELNAFLCDRTIHFFVAEIGNQIQYTAPDGRLHLWFPDRTETVTGRWAVLADPAKEPRICLTFDEPNPAGGPIRQCHELARWQSWIAEGAAVAGDPYALVTGSLPFPLPSHPPLSRASLAERFPEGAAASVCTVPMS